MDYLRPSYDADDDIRRDADDLLPSGYFRYALDRSIGAPQGEFYRFDEIGLIESARRQYQKDGNLNILDAGCGTGRQLWDFVDNLVFFKKAPRECITATGVSDIDFSGESEKWRPRKAIANREINYAVADLNTDPLPHEEFNIIYSYEVLVHNEEPDLIVANMWQALKPGGVMYFNAEGSQRDVIAPVIADILESGSEVIMGIVEPPPLEKMFQKSIHQTRDAYRVRKSKP